MNKDFWDKVEALETLAKQATPGPWEAVEDGSGVDLSYEPDHERTYGYGCDNRFVCNLNDGDYHEYESEEEQKANAQFIATANPAFILEMIEQFRGQLAHLTHRLVEQDIAMNNSKPGCFITMLQNLADKFEKGIARTHDFYELRLFCLGFSVYLSGLIAGMEN